MSTLKRSLVANHLLVVVLSACAIVLVVHGNCAAQCELPPAVILTMETVHSLHPDPDYLSMFQSHLAQITTAYPFFSTICPWLAWVPGEVIIVFTEEALALWEAGEFTGLDELNEKYDVTIGTLRYSSLDLDFDPLLHAHIVAEDYQQVDGVKYAYPNARGTFDCDPTDVTYIPPASYEFHLVDYPRWCVSRTWVVEVTPEGPVVVRGGPVPVDTHSQSWGSLKARFR